jgi:uncharacterized membrane protein YeaQ/YmgE (transglycosylase-associated protein family)
MGEGALQLKDMVTSVLVGQPDEDNQTLLARRAEALVMSLGTLEGMLLLQTARKDGRGVIGSMAAGPVGGVTDSLIQDLWSTTQHGIGWRTFDTVGSRVPVFSPLTGPLVREKVKQESEFEAWKKQE